MLKKISILGLLLLNAKVSIGSEAAAGGPSKSHIDIFEGLDATLFKGDPESVKRYQKELQDREVRQFKLEMKKQKKLKFLNKQAREQALFDQEHNKRSREYTEWNELPEFKTKSNRSSGFLKDDERYQRLVLAHLNRLALSAQLFYSSDSDTE